VDHFVDTLSSLRSTGEADGSVLKRLKYPIHGLLLSKRGTCQGEVEAARAGESAWNNVCDDHFISWCRLWFYSWD
jgi:hypothetical protein